jgi:hypothetical protein
VSVDPGFVKDNVAVLQVFVRPYDTPEHKRAFFDEATARLQRVGRVQTVGAVSALPFIPANIGIRSGLLIHGRPAPLPSEQPTTFVTIATPAYFDVLRIPLLAGRRFTATDGPAGPRVAAINETCAAATGPPAIDRPARHDQLRQTRGRGDRRRRGRPSP